MEKGKSGVSTEEMKNKGDAEMTDTAEVTDTKVKVEKKRKRRTLTGSFPAKVTAFFLLAASSFVTTISVLVCVCCLEFELYSRDDFVQVFMETCRWRLEHAAVDVREWIENGKQEREIRHLMESTNYDVDILWGDAAFKDQDRDKVIWGTKEDTYETEMVQDYYMEFEKEYMTVGGNTFYSGNAYLFRVYVKPEFPNYDVLRETYLDLRLVYELRYTAIWTGLAGGIVTIICFLFLMCSAGNSNRRREAGSAELPCFHLDLLAVFFSFGLAAIAFMWENLWWELRDSDAILLSLAIGAIATVIALWLTLCLYEAARCIKRGKWWQHTLVYVVLRCLWKLIKFLGRGIRAVFRSLPDMLAIIILYFGIVFLEFIFCLALWGGSSEALLVVLEKVILLPVVLYVALCCVKLLKASEALAEGRQDYAVNTTWMLGGFRKHGENLNSIGQGISKAVAERMKSERLKTELITNVSHDLKTPLTSIINYSDLICEEKTENEKITEYAQVLLRQSGRLKKLLEDLVEASKAATGNLEIELVPCEVGVILSQAVVEYQQKLEEKELELISDQPQEPVWIMADGRYLWRVFDNLLNNICKYAQEKSRVYLSVELKAEKVLIIFRNMSKYPLNIPTEELEERFIRGDKSRHMEGNGLGLSIAKSLMDLQNGEMEIVTDGDLFKVTLKFGQKK